MPDTQIAAIITSLAVLVTAIAGLIVALQNRSKLTTLHEQTNGHLEQLTSQLGTTHAQLNAALAAPAWYPPNYLPHWSQVAGRLPDGNPDPEQWNDCGETCVAMLVAGVHGCPVEPGSIRQYLHGVSGSGLTTGIDLVRALAYYSTKTHVESLAGMDAWSVVTGLVKLARNSIILGHWMGPGTYLHWVIVTGVNGATLVYNDPWTGDPAYLTQSQFLELEAGSVVVSDSHIHYDCRAWLNPS